MNSFDKKIRKKLSEEQMEMPASVKNKIECTLQTLPETKKGRKPLVSYPRLAFVSVAIVFVFLFLFPNMSVAYAKTMEKIPFIGDIVKVVTIRNYYYSDERHEMDIKVPKVENDNDNDKVFAPINSDIQELTDTLLKQFNKDLEQIGDDGHSSIYTDYSVVTNTDTWFTLKIQIVQAAGSGNTTYKYYHLNKLTGQVVKLDDIAIGDEFYKQAEQEIEKQMSEKMKQDDQLIYWVNDETFGDCVSIDPQHNFYWDENGNLVIPFDKYEVAPGYMGTPEFTVNKKIIEKYVKDEYKDVME